ncbi:MAG TPA: hypothetical protein VE733_23335 [Streptosporangiaceae bacterium]|nr:hypothetical protein [Streptosporangiaceae bacterium]
MTAMMSAALRWLIARIRAYCGFPREYLSCDQAEGDARAAIGMPARHPEHITRELPRPMEAWLAEVCASLWPDDEYTEIVADAWREDQP